MLKYIKYIKIVMENLNKIKIISYNVLANKWAGYDDLGTLHDRKCYSFIPKDERDLILNWKNRLPKILMKIKEHDPDIICFQEVDLLKINENFINNFSEYDCRHHIIWNKDKKLYKRTNDVGNCILWKKDKFQCFTEINECFNSCAVFAELLHINYNFRFQLINVHLQAGLLSKSKERGSQISSCCKKFINDIPICICGDFNDDLITTNVVRDILANHNFSFYNPQLSCYVYAYNKDTDNDDGRQEYYSLDQIVSKDLDINIDVVPNPKPIPNIDEPSDHYPLIFHINI
jgi:mRNA deadenylase 3'-5' endonuclease subunit Ccr4